MQRRRLTTKKSMLVEILRVPLEGTTSFGGHETLYEVFLDDCSDGLGCKILTGRCFGFFFPVWGICSADRRLVFPN